MFWFKSCPKCHGDLYRNSDAYGTYIACMQCSHDLSQLEEASVGLSTGTPEWGMMVQAELERAAA